MKDAVEKQDMIERLGMVSHLMPKITIFGQKYFKNVTKFDIFTENFLMACHIG